MGRKRPIVHMTVDPLMRNVLDAVADELDITRSRLTETLTAGGLRDVLKAAGEATIPFSEDVERSVSGSAAHSEQVKISEASRLAWTPKDQYAEDTVQKPLRLGPTERAKPTYAHELVEVNSRGMPGATPYQAALKATLRAVRGGKISENDVRSVLKMGGGNECEISEIMKKFAPTFERIEDKLEAVDKSIQKKSDFQSGFAAVMKKHRHILNDDIGG